MDSRAQDGWADYDAELGRQRRIVADHWRRRIEEWRTTHAEVNDHHHQDDTGREHSQPLTMPEGREGEET